MLRVGVLMLAIVFGTSAYADDEHHSHPVPEKLGTVTFQISCAAAVKPAFARAVALLHSFAYTAAEQGFRDVANRDPTCAIAHWGIAMSLFHQLWEPPSAAEFREGAAQVNKATEIRGGSARERQFIEALGAYYQHSDIDAPAVRAQRYAAAMAGLARDNRDDAEAQIFYALALIATAPTTDATHANQKKAIEILEPLYRQQPQHPGLAHYLIHACDSAELAPRGLAAAREYSKIAPSAPHALHMPSHIFTRLGFWDESIASNQAARAAAREQGDVGEELHAMDYLTYAYLQRGRYAEAEQVVVELRAMKDLAASQFKVGYAATAMPIRLAIEQHAWDGAVLLKPLPQSAPQVAALVYWARALAFARNGHPRSADSEIDLLRESLRTLQTSGNTYWATQVDVLLKEAEAWRAAADAEPQAAVAGLRLAADEEDAVEKLPVTPGPIVPAREQLGELLLQLHQPDLALHEFQSALTQAPRRRGALMGAIAAAESLHDTKAVTQLQRELTP